MQIITITSKLQGGIIMKKCLRCESEMVENLEVMVSNGGYGIDVREKGMFKNAKEQELVIWNFNFVKMIKL